MADEKKTKLKTKVKSTVKVSSTIDNTLNEMSKLFIEKPVTGEMELLIKKKEGEIVINEYTISESLGDAYKNLGAKIQESAMADLANEKDGKIKVEFEVSFENIVA